MKTISHKTKELVLGQVINQNIQIGSDTGTVSGILFNNGKEHFPGIRFNKEFGWEYSLDGITWTCIDNARLSFEPIVVHSTDALNGMVVIQHNLGIKYLLGLDYSVMPDQIEFFDENTLRLYFNVSMPDEVVIWFNKSKQSMLYSLINLPKKLISYWSFDESPNETTVIDEMNKFNLSRIDSNCFPGCDGIVSGCWGRQADSAFGLTATEKITAEEYQDGFTFNCWYKLQSGNTGGWTQLVGINKDSNSIGSEGTSFGIHLSYGAPSRIHFAVSSNRTTLESDTIAVWSVDNSTDRWIMVTGVYDKSTKLAKLYVDGVLKSTGTLDKQQPSGYLTVIGNDWGQRGAILVDEFGFWGKVLTDSDITMLYNNGSGLALKYLIRGETIPIQAESTIPQNGLVFYAPLTDRSTTTPSGHLLSYKNVSNPSPIVKNGIQGLWWDGVTNERDIYIRASPLASLSDWSISFWELISSEKSDYTVFTLASSSSEYVMCLSSNSIYNGSNHTGFSGRPVPPETDTVGHIVITHSSGTFSIYVNGKFISSLEQTPKWNQTKELKLYLGERYGNQTGFSFCGMLSHFRIYNRILNDNEIQLLSKEFTPNQ